MKVLVKAHKTAGILIECIQGEGGVKALEPGFVKGLRELCDQEDIVLMVDEVQSGNGRSGYLYSYMAYGIMPDVVTTAKSLGGGLPIGAVMLGEKVENVFGYGDHGSTFGGNPTVCAGAVNLLGRIDDKLLAEVRAKSEYLFKELGSAEGVTGMDGMGLMIGISTVKPCGDVVAKCLENGVMCLTAHGKVRLLPALNIPMELLQEAAAVIKEACKP
jgi:acetylornithine/N-succinyldiaminopimelate aminotransferase